MWLAWLANAGEVPAIIEYNLFQNNDEPGPSSGIGIYTDQHIGGVVSNVLIDANLFHNNSNAGIALNNTDTANPNSEIFISHNQIINVGRGIYLVGTINSLISNNAITNMSSPADGGESAALGIYGGVRRLMITRNSLESGVQYGVVFNDTINTENYNIEIHNNTYRLCHVGAPNRKSTNTNCGLCHLQLVG